jgi:hypothetical protein
MKVYCFIHGEVAYKDRMKHLLNKKCFRVTLFNPDVENGILNAKMAGVPEYVIYGEENK